MGAQPCEEADWALFPKLALPRPSPELEERVYQVKNLTFRADFDSGNLASAKEGSLPNVRSSLPHCSGQDPALISVMHKQEYDLTTYQDCHGSPYQTGHRSWFYFGVSGHTKGEFIVMTIGNMNKQAKLYSNDYRAHYRAHPSMTDFEVLRNRVTYKRVNDSSALRFSHKFDSEEETFFAFCIPWSFQDNERLMQRLDERYLHGVACKGGLKAPLVADEVGSRIYYHRQMLSCSVLGRPQHVITVSDFSGWEPGSWEPSMDGCFPKLSEEGPARLYPRKKLFFISARVHPGETPASHLFNGMLLFLLRSTDPRAAELRKRYVFKLVPIVNPDGVALGHYRVDTLGQNLNRYYLAPVRERQPTIFSITRLVQHYADLKLLDFYIDLHAHANKRGVFTYGNSLTGDQHVESLVYSKLAEVNSAHFDFSGCNFTEKNMSTRDRDGTTKDGAGRVAFYKLTGLTHLYTIEANYNSARQAAVVPRARGDTEGRSSPPPGARAGQRYDRSSFHQVGRALLVAALDMQGANPWSRVGGSQFGSLQGVREWVIACIRAAAERKNPLLPAMSEASQLSIRELPKAKNVVTTPATTARRLSLIDRQAADAASRAAVRPADTESTSTAATRQTWQPGLSRTSTMLRPARRTTAPCLPRAASGTAAAQEAAAEPASDDNSEEDEAGDGSAPSLKGTRVVSSQSAGGLCDAPGSGYARGCARAGAQQQQEAVGESCITGRLLACATLDLSAAADGAVVPELRFSAAAEHGTGRAASLPASDALRMALSEFAHPVQSCEASDRDVAADARASGRDLCFNGSSHRRAANRSPAPRDDVLLGAGPLLARAVVNAAGHHALAELRATLDKMNLSAVQRSPSLSQRESYRGEGEPARMRFQVLTLVSNRHSSSSDHAARSQRNMRLPSTAGRAEVGGAGRDASASREVRSSSCGPAELNPLDASPQPGETMRNGPATAPRRHDSLPARLASDTELSRNQFVSHPLEAEDLLTGPYVLKTSDAQSGFTAPLQQDFASKQRQLEAVYRCTAAMGESCDASIGGQKGHLASAERSARQAAHQHMQRQSWSMMMEADELLARAHITRQSASVALQASGGSERESMRGKSETNNAASKRPSTGPGPGPNRMPSQWDRTESRGPHGTYHASSQERGPQSSTGAPPAQSDAAAAWGYPERRKHANLPLEHKLQGPNADARRSHGASGQRGADESCTRPRTGGRRSAQGAAAPLVPLAPPIAPPSREVARLLAGTEQRRWSRTNRGRLHTQHRGDSRLVQSLEYVRGAAGEFIRDPAGLSGPPAFPVAALPAARCSASDALTLSRSAVAKGVRHSLRSPPPPQTLRSADESSPGPGRGDGARNRALEFLQAHEFDRAEACRQFVRMTGAGVDAPALRSEAAGAQHAAPSVNEMLHSIANI